MYGHVCFPQSEMNPLHAQVAFTTLYLSFHRLSCGSNSIACYHLFQLVVMIINEKKDESGNFKEAAIESADFWRSLPGCAKPNLALFKIAGTAACNK